VSDLFGIKKIPLVLVAFPTSNYAGLF